MLKAGGAPVYDEELDAGRRLADRVFKNDSSIKQLAEQVRAAVVSDTEPPPQPPASPPPPPPKARRSPWAIVGTVLAAIAATLGLAMLAFIILLLSVLNGWSSNK